MTSTEQLRARLLEPRPTDRLWGWLGPGLIALVGGVLRFWRLGDPHQLVFDETYYVKQGWSLVQHGVELRTRDGLQTPDALFTAGTPDVFGTAGDMVVHPSVGKWLIGLGELAFGVTSSVGWRAAVALLGTLSILMLGRVARRLLGSTTLGCVAAFLLAFEGLHFVMSRTAILDIIVMVFVLAGFGALLVDRERSRERLAVAVGSRPPGSPLTSGPWLGWRPWRWVAGLMLGLATSTKWSGIFVVAAFGLMTVWWDLGARRTAGVRHWARAGLLRDGPFAFVQLVVVTLVTYVASWTGWFLSTDGYHRQWSALNPGQGVRWLPEPLRNLWQYHVDMWAFSANLTTPHSYQSNPWGWLVQARPTSFFYEGPTRGQGGCHVEQCSKAITSVGTLPLWWGGVLALLVCLAWWLARRDWRAGAIWAGVVGGYLPWFAFQHRTIFSFYAVAFEPFVVLAVTFVIGLVLRPDPATGARRRGRVAGVAAYLLVCLGVFAYFLPVYTAQVIPYAEWARRMWFPSWI